uniref:Uncharacterized protein n=1 Tax=Opuntia streptacantha TaxID=393608 RepID=A0A7C8YLX5_OPUST
MRDPPERTTVNAPLSFTNLSDKSATYLAKETDSSSSESKTSNFPEPFWDATSAIEAFALKTLEEPLKCRITGTLRLNRRLKFEGFVKEIRGFGEKKRDD